MHVEAQQGNVVVKLGRRFAVADAEHLREVMDSFAPLSNIVVDFSAVREFHDAAFLSVSDALRAFRSVPVMLRGLPLHQTRLLSYLRRASERETHAGALRVRLAAAAAEER